MSNRLIGQLTIVAGVFIVFGGACLGLLTTGIPMQGVFTIAVSVMLVLAGPRAVRSSKELGKNGG